MADDKADAKDSETPGERSYLGILFKCCQVYGRIYRTRAGDAYAGHCPRCAQAVRVRIDPDGGVDARFFEVR
jgi:hypothetical protein